MSYSYEKPFDRRLNVMVKVDNNEEEFSPVSGKSGTNVYSYLMTLETLMEKKDDFYKISKKDFNGQEIFNVMVEKQLNKIKEEREKDVNALQNAIMNPYAMLRLSNGLKGTKTNVIDKADKSPWYEYESAGLVGYTKVPTTSAIIEWGRQDKKSRTPYLFQDFVFSKWWNKIPNNRMITLRRYGNPVLDNLNTPVDCTYNEEGKMTDLQIFPPMATAVTYFGEETGNNLKDILKFSTAYKWGEAKADIWDLTLTTGSAPSSNEVMSGAMGAIGIQYGNEIAKVMNALSVMNGNGPATGSGLAEKNGLPPDPYKDGPYTNRIMGPVNRIDTVKKREAGLKFEMGGMKIKFSYVARPIGGINSKAIMLDILSNFMIMGSTSAVFFGGAHRSRIPGRRFPAGNNKAIQELYKGNVLGENGAVASFGKQITSFFNDNGGVSGVVATMFDAAKGIVGDLLNALGNPFGMKVDAKTQKGKTAKEKIANAVGEKMKSGMSVPYVQGMRSILTGDPVGEWHLTIGNPMNPIAMIGNLICTNLEVEIDEEAGLGPDDFPLGWNITVSLEPGMARDRDTIESMFNLGNGRIYEVADDFIGSSDFVTKVDKATQKDSSGYSVKTYRHEVKSEKNYKGSSSELKSLDNAQEKQKIISMNLSNINATGFDGDINRLPTIAITNFNARKIGK